MNNDSIWFLLQCYVNIGFQVSSCSATVCKFIDESRMVDCSCEVPDGVAMNVTVSYKAEFVLIVVV